MQGKVKQVFCVLVWFAATLAMESFPGATKDIPAGVTTPIHALVLNPVSFLLQALIAGELYLFLTCRSIFIAERQSMVSATQSTTYKSSCPVSFT